jgi:hypothetical protein
LIRLKHPILSLQSKISEFKTLAKNASRNDAIVYESIANQFEQAIKVLESKVSERHFLITGECSKGVSVYVSCKEEEIDQIAMETGVGCSQCRIYQEVPKTDTLRLDIVSIDGVLFQKSYWMLPNTLENRRCGT